MRAGRGGFTLIETLIAIVILSIGLLAMAATSGAITTTLTGARFATTASQRAALTMEELRVAAHSTVMPCTSGTFASSASSVVVQGVTVSWVVPATGGLRQVRVITQYPIGRGRTKTDTLTTQIRCG